MLTPFYKIYINNRDVSDFVERMEFEDCVTEDSLLELTFCDDHSLTLADDEDFVTGKIISFQFGFLANKMSPIHKARISDVNVRYDDHVKLIVKALDLGNKAKKSTANKVWNGTATDIAKTIAAKYGLDVEVDPTSKVWKIPQGHRNDMELLHYMAKRESDGNYVVFIRDSKLYFVRRGLNKVAGFSFNYGNDERIQYFNVEWKETTVPSGSIKTKTVQTNMLDKTHKGSSADSKTQKNAIALGDYVTVYDENANKVGERKVSNNSPVAVVQQAKDAAWGTAAEMGKAFNTPTGDDEEASNLANSEIKDGKLHSMECTLQLDGEPQAFPNEVFTMLGVAERHIGNWYIDKVRHVIEGNATYSTTLHGAKNATKANTGDKAPVATVNKSVGKKKQGEDPKIISVYNQDAIHVGDKTASGKYVPLK